ncbi:MAG: ion transporter [SAR86 cluster bacterium]|jgi:voltage-gated sodium channel|nr:ion transporter [SAR86 cluster bacterium]
MNSFVTFFLKIRNSNIFSGIVIAVIVASAIYAGVSSYDIPPEYTFYLDLFNYAITLFFLIEIIIRMISERSLIKFFSDGWNIFDFLIVTISLVPINNVESVFVARLLRIIRVLRIITVVPAFRHIIDSLIKTIPRVGFIALLMFIFMYVWGAIGTMFFGKVDPENWGNIGLALITLVQVSTYDDWANIMGQVIDVYPYAWIFFVSFIVINAVILLNMVIGVIVDVMISQTGIDDVLQQDKDDPSN